MIVGLDYTKPSAVKKAEVMSIVNDLEGEN